MHKKYTYTNIFQDQYKKNYTTATGSTYIRKRFKHRTHKQEDKQQERTGDDGGHLSHASDRLLDQRPSQRGGDGTAAEEGSEHVACGLMKGEEIQICRLAV